MILILAIKPNINKPDRILIPVAGIRTPGIEVLAVTVDMGVDIHSGRTPASHFKCSLIRAVLSSFPGSLVFFQEKSKAWERGYSRSSPVYHCSVMTPGSPALDS